MTRVKKLAALLCPECNGDGQHQSMGPHDIRVEECPTCHGTGTLIPEMVRKCLCKAHKSNIIDPPDDFDWALFNEQMHKMQGMMVDSGPIDCQGQGWVPKSEAEQRLAMESWAVEHGFNVKYYGVEVSVERRHYRSSAPYKIFRVPDNDALASAILQALGQKGSGG